MFLFCYDSDPVFQKNLNSNPLHSAPLRSDLSIKMGYPLRTQLPAVLGMLRIRNGYLAIFIRIGAASDLNFFLQTGTEQSGAKPDLNISKKKILVDQISVTLIKLLWSNRQSKNDLWRYLDDLSSYKPISLLCISCKILEKLPYADRVDQ